MEAPEYRGHARFDRGFRSFQQFGNLAVIQFHLKAEKDEFPVPHGQSVHYRPDDVLPFALDREFERS
jgi:hypothetical protein